MSKPFPLVLAVDAFLARPKSVLAHGMDDWVEVNGHQRDGEMRIIWPVIDQGVSRPGMDLVLVAHADHTPQTWHINLLFNSVRIMGFDCEPEHRTPPNVLRADQKSVLPYIVKGTHFHLWGDNTHFAKKNSLPVSLNVARPAPANLLRFDSALRWFCAEANIQLTVRHMDLPMRTRIL